MKKSFGRFICMILVGFTSFAQSSLTILGTYQDGGRPHIGCSKACCAALRGQPNPLHRVVSLGLYDQTTQKRYLFEATPDIVLQLKDLHQIGVSKSSVQPDGIFLTHAHMGHYSGLMYLGKEALGAQKVPVYAMPRMTVFLQSNGPWEQLISQKNIVLNPLMHGKPVILSETLQVIPIQVPHRDEYSETVGFKIKGPHKSALFIPDIDKWDQWDRSILKEIRQVDYAFLDATFFDGAEINYRDIRQIPHPFVVESLEKFQELSPTDRAKVIFIHTNHTNPIADPESEATRKVLEAGYRIARIHERFEL